MSSLKDIMEEADKRRQERLKLSLWEQIVVWFKRLFKKVDKSDDSKIIVNPDIAYHQLTDEGKRMIEEKLEMVNTDILNDILTDERNLDDEFQSITFSSLSDNAKRQIMDLVYEDIRKKAEMTNPNIENE